MVADIVHSVVFLSFRFVIFFTTKLQKNPRNNEKTPKRNSENTPKHAKRRQNEIAKTRQNEIAKTRQNTAAG